MGGLFGGSQELPAPPAVIPMPDPEDKRRKIVAKRKASTREGRQATILSDKLG